MLIISEVNASNEKIVWLWLLQEIKCLFETFHRTEFVEVYTKRNVMYIQLKTVE